MPHAVVVFISLLFLLLFPLCAYCLHTYLTKVVATRCTKTTTATTWRRATTNYFDSTKFSSEQPEHRRAATINVKVNKAGQNRRYRQAESFWGGESLAICRDTICASHRFFRALGIAPGPRSIRFGTPSKLYHIATAPDKETSYLLHLN